MGNSSLIKLKKLTQNPLFENSQSIKDLKERLSALESIKPDLFEEKKIPQEYTKGMVGAGAQPISESKLSPITGATPESIADKTSKLIQTGLVKGYGSLMDKGYVPEIKQTFGESMKELAKYPLNKLMDTLNIFPRAESAITKQAYKKAIESGEVPKVSDFKLSEYDVGEQAKKNLNPLEALKTLNIGKEGWKQVAKETFEPLVKANSKYSGMGFTQAYEEMFPDTKFTKEFEYPKEWEQGSKLQKTLANVLPNEEGNWWQRLISGFAGSPADIAGLATDIVGDPFTYFGGGLAKGAKTGVSMADDLIKQGTKILPKGAEIGLTKAGRTAFNTFKESSGFDDIIRGLADDLVTPSGVVKGLEATDTVAKQTAINFMENKALNQFLQEVPDIASVNKYLDFGGLKIAGGTAIEGYKLAEKLGKLKNTKIVKTFGNLFNENANVPDELVPFKNWLISAGETEKNAFANAFYKIIKDGDKTDFDKVQKYLWIQSDIERKAGNLDLISKYTKELDDLKMTDKQLKIADDLKVFWGDVAQQFKNATGKELNTYEFYTPIRYVNNEEDILKKASLIGPAEQPFEQSRILTRTQAEELGLKPKDLITSSIQRLAEQEKNIFRSRLINEVKQFGSQTADEGMSAISKIPELDGWYLPKEYEKVFNNTYRMFFADPSLNKLAKIYDKGLGLWKRYALSTTGYDFRNFYTDNVSGLMEYGLKYYNPKYWADGVAVLKGSKKRVMLNGKLRYADDLLKEMKQTGEITETTMTAVEAGYGKARKLIENLSPVEAKFKYVSMPRENLGRVIAGLIERDSGANKIVAANNVKKVFFDYAHSLTPVERNVAKRIIPFYCVDTETEALTKEGWKKYNELEIGNEALTININTGNAEWKPVTNLFISEYSGEMYSFESQQISALTTPDHKWAVKRAYKLDTDKHLRLKESKDLNKYDIIPNCAENVDLSSTKIYTDDFVRLIGWVVTEGHYKKNSGYTIEIAQSNTHNPKYVLEIENTLKRLNARYHEFNAGTDKKIHYFGLTGEYAKQIRSLLPDKILTPEFILQLTKKQIDLLIEILCKADGSYSYNNIVLQTNNKMFADNIQFMLSIAGYTSYLSKRANYGNYSNGNISYNITIKHRKNARITGTKINKVDYEGFIWCPKTDNETWFARRNGKVYFTGNTWLKNNARRQVELLFTRTGRYAAIPKSINFVENISDKPEGFDEFQQDYQKDLGAFMTPLRQPGLPDWLANILGREKTEKAGMPLSFNPNFAFQDFSRMNPKDLFSAMSPLIKALIELGFNKEIYFDSEIPNYTKAPKVLDLIFGKLPEGALDKMGMKKGNNEQLLLSGKLNYLLKSFIPTYSLAARSFPTTDTENTPYQNLSSLLGIKFMPYNEEKAKKEYYQNYSEKADEALNAYSKANLQEGESLPSTAQIKSVYKEAYYKALEEKYKEALNAKNLFDLLNMPKEATQQLDKALEPYEAEKAKVKDMNIYELEELLMEYDINLTLEDIQEIIRQKQLEQ